MKKNPVSVAVVFSFFAVLIFSVATHGQIFAEEVRPFDFTDEYYKYHGIVADSLIDRKTGGDGQSVVDTPSDQSLSNIRIIATLPAYTAEGSTIFWNYYGGASNRSFTRDRAGQRAIELAYANPMYVFPSTTVKNSDRQAAMIRMSDSYFEKNELGMAAVFIVEYTSRQMTHTDRAALTLLGNRNGLSRDGTPIIRTVRELDGLYAADLITIRQAGTDGSDRTPFAVAKVLDDTDRGSIAPDAFLIYVKKVGGKPLDAEAHMFEMFECLQGGGRCF